MTAAAALVPYGVPNPTAVLKRVYNEWSEDDSAPEGGSLLTYRRP